MKEGMEGVRFGSFAVLIWIAIVFAPQSIVTVMYYTRRGLLMLCRRFGVVVLLGVIFGSLAFSPGDDAMDMLFSSSMLICLCLFVVGVLMDGDKLSFIELDNVIFPV